MITLAQGDILLADVEALVNTVNCVGIMGRGIALQFRKAFPENFVAYENVCKRSELHPGMMLFFDLGRLQSKIEDIAAGLNALTAEIAARGIRSVAVPPLGCGLGGLDWDQVRPMIEAAFADLPDVRVLLYQPTGAPEPEKMVKASDIPNMTVGRAALIGLMRRYLAAVMDPYVSLLEIHKLMYFMQEAGEPLRLTYRKARYGPYSENLRHVLSRIEGHFISGFADAGDDPEKQIELKPAAVDIAEAFLEKHPTTQQRFERVVDLIEGFESTYGMELLATIHWVTTREGAASVQEAIAKTHGWNERKRMFSPEHIQVAWDVLRSKHWLATS